MRLIGDITSSNNKDTQFKELETVCKNNPDNHAMQTSITRQAAELFKNGYLASALEKYVSLRDATGLAAWDYQISLIRRQFLSHCPNELAAESFAGVFRFDLGVEHIYVLNLANRPDRKKRALKEFASLGFSAGEIEFVNGIFGENDETARMLTQRFKALASGSNSSCLQIPESILAHDQAHATPGVFGYILSQRNIFKDALTRGYRRFAVFDDDAFFAPNAASVLHRFVNSGRTWQILLLGASNYFLDDGGVAAALASQASKYGYYHPVPFVTCGSFAVCYDSSILPSLLDLASRAEGYFDRHILAYIYQNHRATCFALSPPAFGADVTESDIRQPRDMHAHAQAMGWDSSRFAEYRSP